ncbi:MAG: CotH kinase family protein [Oscillospiraceae bacterium]|nr:CotH kinase family protein [Oscillospiraceae bacterium]
MQITIKKSISIILLFIIIFSFTNIQAFAESEKINMPVFSVEAGFCDEAFELELSDENNNAIYYTTDGSDPRTSETAILYTDKINIYDNSSESNKYSALTDITLYDNYIGATSNVDKGIIIRAVCKTSSGEYSDVAYHSYFINKQAEYYKSMKVISLATDGDYLFDSDNGAYMIGSEYYNWLEKIYHPEYKDGNNTNNPTNYNKDGEESKFPVSIQVFENGTCTYTTDVGARIAGNFSRGLPQKSIRFYARKEYGNSKMKYAFIDSLTDKNGNLIEKYDKITLRNAGNDNEYLHFRDAFIQDIVSERACDVQGVEPCILFIDGEFWGFYFIREKIDDYYIQSHYEIEKENVTIIKNGELACGSQYIANDYYSFIEWASTADMTIPENYQLVCDKIDIQNFMDYIAIETYINNTDWAKSNPNNWQVWRATIVDSNISYADAKWHFMLFNLDMTAGANGRKERLASFDHLSNMNREGTSFATMFYNFLNNDDFKQKFYDNYIEIIETVFNPEQVDKKITDYVFSYRQATLATRERFSRDGNDYVNFNYDEEVEIFREFFQERPEYAKKYLDKLVTDKSVFIRQDICILLGIIIIGWMLEILAHKILKSFQKKAKS